MSTAPISLLQYTAKPQVSVIFSPLLSDGRRDRGKVCNINLPWDCASLTVNQAWVNRVMAEEGPASSSSSWQASIELPRSTAVWKCAVRHGGQAFGDRLTVYSGGRDDAVVHCTLPAVARVKEQFVLDWSAELMTGYCTITPASETDHLTIAFELPPADSIALHPDVADSPVHRNNIGHLGAQADFLMPVRGCRTVGRLECLVDPVQMRIVESDAFDTGPTEVAVDRGQNINRMLDESSPWYRGVVVTFEGSQNRAVEVPRLSLLHGQQRDGLDFSPLPDDHPVVTAFRQYDGLPLYTLGLAQSSFLETAR